MHVYTLQATVEPSLMVLCRVLMSLFNNSYKITTEWRIPILEVPGSSFCHERHFSDLLCIALKITNFGVRKLLVCLLVFNVNG